VMRGGFGRMGGLGGWRIRVGSLLGVMLGRALISILGRIGREFFYVSILYIFRWKEKPISVFWCLLM
jgi:hypothetical protein